MFNNNRDNEYEQKYHTIYLKEKKKRFKNILINNLSKCLTDG